MSAPKYGSWLSTFVIAIFITAHLLPTETYWATSIFYGKPYSVRGGPQPLAQAILIAFFAVELSTILVLSWIIDGRLARWAKRPWLQLHLSTSLILMVVASGLVLLHLETVRLRIGSYTIDYLPVHFLFANYTLIGVAFLAEAWARRRNPDGLGSDRRSESIEPASSDPSTFQTMTASTNERLLHAIPLAILFVLTLLSPLLIDPVDAILRNSRIDLALPTRLLFGLRAFPIVVLLGILVLAVIYLQWISRDRKRLYWFNAIVVSVMVLGILGALFSLIAPFMPIQDRL